MHILGAPHILCTWHWSFPYGPWRLQLLGVQALMSGYNGWQWWWTEIRDYGLCRQSLLTGYSHFMLLTWPCSASSSLFSMVSTTTPILHVFLCDGHGSTSILEYSMAPEHFSMQLCYIFSQKGNHHSLPACSHSSTSPASALLINAVEWILHISQVYVSDLWKSGRSKGKPALVFIRSFVLSCGIPVFIFSQLPIPPYTRCFSVPYALDE